MSVHQLTIGEIECAVLQDAEFSKSSQKVAERYPTVKLEDIEAALSGTDTKDSINCLYINSAGRASWLTSASAAAGSRPPVIYGKRLRAQASA